MGRRFCKKNGKVAGHHFTACFHDCRRQEVGASHFVSFELGKEGVNCPTAGERCRVDIEALIGWRLDVGSFRSSQVTGMAASISENCARHISCWAVNEVAVEPSSRQSMGRGLGPGGWLCSFFATQSGEEPVDEPMIG